MASRIMRTLTTTLTLTFLSQALALAQNQPTPAPPPAADPPTVDIIHIRSDAPSTWDYAPSRAPSGRKLFVVTLARPTHRTACRVQSFTVDRLVCKGSFGTTRIYKPQEIAALITPDDEDVRLWLVLGLNGAAATAAWGTFVLAATCIPCAVATAVVAAAVFFSIGAVLMADGQPETVLYLAPGQTLHVKLRY